MSEFFFTEAIINIHKNLEKKSVWNFFTPTLIFMNHENAHKTKKRPEIALQVGLEKITQGLPTDKFFLYKS